MPGSASIGTLLNNQSFRISISLLMTPDLCARSRPIRTTKLNFTHEMIIYEVVNKQTNKRSHNKITSGPARVHKIVAWSTYVILKWRLLMWTVFFCIFYVRSYTHVWLYLTEINIKKYFSRVKLECFLKSKYFIGQNMFHWIKHKNVPNDVRAPYIQCSLTTKIKVQRSENLRKRRF